VLIEKNSIAIVDMEFMNDVHYEDIEIINNLLELILKYENRPNEESKDSLTKQYKLWYEHTVVHFKIEEDLMLEKQFSPYMMHKAEHDNALNIMKNELDNWLNFYDIHSLKRYIIEDIPLWLNQHISTMDTITARFFKTGEIVCH
jgi:hemerythrin